MAISTNTGIQYKRAVGVFKTRRETEQALYQLRDEGFDLKQVSVIAPDQDPATLDAELEVHEESHGNKADEGAVAGAVTGGALGTIAGLLVGLGALAIPGIGPILLAGVEATALATTLAGTAIGATTGGIVGALVGLGIPEERAKVYNERLSKGHYLVMVTGTPETINGAEKILRNHGIEEWEVYDASNVEVVPEDEKAIPTQPVVESEAVATQRREDIHHPDYSQTVKRETASDEPQVVVIDRRHEESKNL